MNKAEKVLSKVMNRLEVVSNQIESIKKDIQYNQENGFYHKNTELTISLNS